MDMFRISFASFACAKLYLLCKTVHFSSIFCHQTLLAKKMHSNSVIHSYNGLKVKVLPALSDNYMYLLIDQLSNEAAVVDPVDPCTIIQTLYEENIHLTTVLTTHHHWDHAGGNAELVAKMIGKNLTVVGGDERIQAVSKIVSQGDELRLGNLSIKCLSTPCHTTGHICYYVSSRTADHPIVFTGDTLFVAGCGRFFEGTAEMMDKALNKVLAKLPEDTRVYCGHEYTTTNLKFALSVEPYNEDVQRKLQYIETLRKDNNPTVPSTIAEEKQTNPFMRVDQPTVMSYAHANNIITTMSYLRKQKDSFTL